MKLFCDTCMRTVEEPRIREGDDCHKMALESFQCEPCWNLAQEKEARRPTEGYDEDVFDGGRRSDATGRL